MPSKPEQPGSGCRLLGRACECARISRDECIHDPPPVMNSTNIVAFIASIVVGFGVLYANPKRSINRAFFLLSVNVTAWILSLGRLTAVPEIPNPVLWLRITHAIASYIPLLLWIIKDCARRTNFDRDTVRKGWPWLVVAILMTS